MPPARICLTLSRHFFLSFIAYGRSSGLHTVSSQSCCMCVRADRPAFVRPYVGVHGNTSLMSSSLLLQQCPACLIRLTWIVFVMGGRWPYSWCFVGPLTIPNVKGPDLPHYFLIDPVGWEGAVKSDWLRNRSKRVRTPVALLRSLSCRYPW